MALLFIDSFDHYTCSPQDMHFIAEKWSGFNLGGGFYVNPYPSIAVGSGRNSTAIRPTHCLRWGAPGNAAQYSYLFKEFTPRSTIFMGFAMRFSPGDPSYSYATLSTFVSGFDWHFCSIGNIGFRVTTDSRIVIDALNGTSSQIGSFLGPSPVFSLNTAGDLARTNDPIDWTQWHYIEIRVSYDDADGVVELRVDGQTVLGLNGVNVGPPDGLVYLGHRWGKSLYGVFTNFYYDFDDFYLLDDIGGERKSFLGPIVISALKPVARGFETQWIPTGATENWDCVNDRPAPNASTDYVRTVTKGARDTYRMERVRGVGPILGAQYVTDGRKSEGGIVILNSVSRKGTQVGLSTDVGLFTDFVLQPRIAEQNPATGADWQVSDFNAPDAFHGIQLTG